MDCAGGNRFPQYRGAPVFLIALPVLYMILITLLVPISMVTKWVLMGRYRADNHPLWGVYYLRWWMVRLPSVAGPLVSYFRAQHVCRDCHIRSIARVGMQICHSFVTDIFSCVPQVRLFTKVALSLGSSPFTGSTLLVYIYRVLGVKIGKRVLIESLELSEFDLIEIGDDCVIEVSTTTHWESHLLLGVHNAAELAVAVIPVLESSGF